LIFIEITIWTIINSTILIFLITCRVLYLWFRKWK